MLCGGHVSALEIAGTAIIRHSGRRRRFGDPLGILSESAMEDQHSHGRYWRIDGVIICLCVLLSCRCTKSAGCARHTFGHSRYRATDPQIACPQPGVYWFPRRLPPGIFLFPDGGGGDVNFIRTKHKHMENKLLDYYLSQLLKMSLGVQYSQLKNELPTDFKWRINNYLQEGIYYLIDNGYAIAKSNTGDILSNHQEIHDDFIISLTFNGFKLARDGGIQAERDRQNAEQLSTKKEIKIMRRTQYWIAAATIATGIHALWQILKDF